MNHKEQALEAMQEGLKGPAYLIVTFSEGSWVDRMVVSAMAHKLFDRPAATNEEVTLLAKYWSEHADDSVIMDFLENKPPVTEKIDRETFIQWRDELKTILPS